MANRPRQKGKPSGERPGRERSTLAVGQKLKAYRQQRGLSIRALAERAGLSPNSISLIERDISSPTVATLYQLATAMDIPICSLLEEEQPQEDVHFLRSQERKKWLKQGLGIEVLCREVSPQRMQAMIVTLGPGVGSGLDMVVHPGHELVLCLQGEVHYRVGDSTYILHKEDSLLFDASIPHGWHNPSQEGARFLLVLEAGEDAEAYRQHM